LTEAEYQKIVDILKREPSMTEIGIFSVMWSEHCSYKSSRVHLRRLPTRGPAVLQGPGENAGIIDIGDGLAVAFKIESHNHPSFIEPFQGAATGVGGILRDIFTMGARPIAAMNSLRFGPLDKQQNKRILEGVVGGIAFYGNCFGVPCMEKLLLEACLEAMQKGLIVGIQDMGAAGLTCSSCEMGARAGTGVELDLDVVPQRETGMTAYEIMLSESQERMLLVAEKSKEKAVSDVFHKWELDAVTVGRVTNDGLLRVRHQGRIVAEIPNGALAEEAPVYQRPLLPPKSIMSSRLDDYSFRDGCEPALTETFLSENNDWNKLLKLAVSSPNLSSRRWVW